MRERPLHQAERSRADVADAPALAAGLVGFLPVLAVLIEFALHGLDGAGGAISGGGLVLASTFATVMVWRRWRIVRGWYLGLLAASGAVWGAGVLVSAVSRQLSDGEWVEWPAALGFLGWSVLVAVSVTSCVGGLARSRRIPLVSDAAVLAAALAVITWELVLRNGVAGLSLARQVALTAFPIIDMVVVSVASVLLLQQRSRSLRFAAAGIVAMLVGDLLYANVGGSVGSVAYLLALVAWAASFGLLAVAGASPHDAAPIEERPRPARLVLVYVPGLALLAMITVEYLVLGREAHLTTAVLLGVYVVMLGINQAVRWLEASGFAARLLGSIDHLRSVEAELRTLLDDIPEGVIVVDGADRIVEANEVTLQLTGRDKGDLIGTALIELVGAEHRGPLEQLLVAIRDDDLTARHTEPVVLQRSGRDPVLVEAEVVVPVRDPNQVVITLRDVTSRVEASIEYERARERFRLGFHAAPIGMALTRFPDSTVIDVNEPLLQILGITRDRLIGHRIDDLIHPGDRARTAAMEEQVRDGAAESFRAERRYLRSDGTYVWGRTWVSVLKEADGELLSIVHVEDITEQRTNAAQLEWAAAHDALTRLPNRSRFEAELKRRLEVSPPGSVAVLFIDLDNFKVINDSLGHATGDEVLRAMTERLRAVLREGDMLSRFGGDEFTVLLSDYADTGWPLSLAERLRHEITQPILVDDLELFITASIGISLADGPGLDASILLRDADAAMYRAKARGRDCVEVFAPGAHDASVLALRTRNELRRGLERGEILPYYQPIVDLSTGLVTGYEVLARWQHPERGLLGADKFLPMAEETGLIAEVGESVLRASLVQLGRWRDRHESFRDVTVAVNVSARQLLDPRFVDLVGDALTEAGVPADSLWLEITETSLMKDVKAAGSALRELRSMGLHLGVDDFGTGYSSLTYLKRFPVEAIKVDRSFVNGLGIDADDTTIVEAVIKLGHSLGLAVVAEGVETPLQLNRLREIRCDKAQGYLFGRPRSGAVLESDRLSDSPPSVLALQI